MAELGFFRQAEANATRVALVDPDGVEVTAGELAGRANQVAHGLRAAGLGKGDTVAIVVPNGVPMLEVYLAATSIGLYVTPINHHLVGPEIAYILSDSEAKVLVGHERFADVLQAAVQEAGFPLDKAFAIGGIAGWRPYAELTDGQPAERPPDRAAGGPMHYTSGTTGKPKGVKRALPDIDPDELAGLYSMFLMMFGVQPEDGNVHITGSPLYHTAVLLWTANSLHMGHSVVLMDKWTPEGMLELIDRHKVTTSHMVPTQFHRLLALPEEVRSKYDCSSTRCMVHAAAPCPPDVKRKMIEWWGDAIMEYYAATEGGGTIVTAKEWLERPGTVGKAWGGSEIRILDDESNVLGPGEIGTIYMLLAQAMFEYKGDEVKTQGSRVYFPAEEKAFFTVGDVGEMDEDGYLFLRDRKIDMIISGGVNIYPAEIEGTFLSCPLVGDVAVFGIPNDDWGEEIKLVVEPAAGQAAGPDLEAKLREFAEANLASYKRPKSYDFTNEMPRDPSGKLYKRKLRDPYWEGKARAI